MRPGACWQWSVADGRNDFALAQVVNSRGFEEVGRGHGIDLHGHVLDTATLLSMDMRRAGSAWPRHAHFRIYMYIYIYIYTLPCW